MDKWTFNLQKGIAVSLTGIIFVPGFFRFDLSSKYNALFPAEILATILIFAIFIAVSIWIRSHHFFGNKDKLLSDEAIDNKYIFHLTTENHIIRYPGLMLATIKNKDYSYSEATGGKKAYTDDCGIIDQNELLMNIDENGNIQFVTEETALAYGKETHDFVGKNITDLKNLLGIDTSIWYDRLSRDYHVQSAVEVQVEGKKKWIFWNFEAITNHDHMIDLIVASGQEITKLVNPSGSEDMIRLIDYQTSLLNQQGMFEKIANLDEVHQAVSFYIYLSNLAEINDYYGHSVGDEIILRISNELLNYQNEDCFAARFSSGKFVGFCINQYATDLAIDFYLRKLNHYITAPHNIDKSSIHLDIRVGYARYPEDTEQLEKLISLSSMAMQTSSQDPQSRIVRYEKYMLETLDRNIQISTKLKMALDQNLIEVHFQKALNVTNKKVVYLEELARWKDPELGYVSPIQLFKIAKDYNQLDRLERYLVDKAMVAFHSIKKMPEYSQAKLAINIAPTTLLDPLFIEHMNACAKKHQIHVNEICIEISEGTFVAKLESCINRIKEYKKQGYLIAIDDFGKDYSSLAILESIEFDLIKIDKLFIDKISDEKIKEIVRMIRKITDLSERDIIAEGVETEEQSLILLDLGCYLQQGYYFHRPEKMT